ncbi:DNRLRE domain-containing protein [Nonomuraea sp. NPDC050663]|uniref:DNRLRE domain-containing protein n=1 Tax=Nonomuraea sp. NPDC050663 TaxID=3364370 RepID=UPI0037AFA526
MISRLTRALLPVSILLALTAAPAQATTTTTATISIRPSTWAYVSSSEPKSQFIGLHESATLGLQGDFGQAPDEPETNRRSFFTYDVAGLRNVRVTGVTFTFVPTVEPGCDNRVRGFSLWRTGPIGKHTSWDRQPEWDERIGAAMGDWGGPCSPNDVFWPYKIPVENAIPAGAETVTVGIRGGETVSQGRLLLDNNPEMLVTYEYDRRESTDVTGLPYQHLTQTALAYVESGHQNVPHWNPSGKDELQVGSPDGHRRFRSFIRFDLSSLRDDPIYHARLYFLTAGACRAGEGPVEVWETGAISEETTWHRQPEWERLIDTYVWEECGNWPKISFDLTRAIKEARAAGRTTLTIGLRSVNETDRFGWMELGNGPLIKVSFRHPLQTPVDLMTAPEGFWWPDGRTVPPVPCLSGDARRYVPFSPMPQAVFSGGGPRWRATWQWQTLDGQPRHEETGEFTTETVVRASRVGTDGEALRWRVRAEDSTGEVSEWSQWCEYIMDSTRPDVAPGVTGTPYTGRDPVGAPGVPGTFAFTAHGVADAAEFAVIPSGHSRPTYVPVGADGTATWTWTPTQSGFHQVFVAIVDRAGNWSPGTFHYFVVGEAAPQ